MTVTVAMVLITITIIFRLFTWYETRVLSLIQCQSGLFCSKQILKEYDFQSISSVAWQPGLKGFCLCVAEFNCCTRIRKKTCFPKMWKWQVGLEQSAEECHLPVCQVTTTLSLASVAIIIESRAFPHCSHHHQVISKEISTSQIKTPRMLDDMQLEESLPKERLNLTDERNNRACCSLFVISKKIKCLVWSVQIYTGEIWGPCW